MRYHQIIKAEQREFSTLYHGTSSKHLRSILAVGLSAPNHWGSTVAMARIFAKDKCGADGGRPIIIAMPLSGFHTAGFQIDGNMIDCPVDPNSPRSSSMDMDALYDAWEKTEQTWMDCLRIYGSVIYNAPMTVFRSNIVSLRTASRLAYET